MTSKQQAVAKDLLENTGKPISRAMKDAGYALTSAKNPQQLTRSKSWQKLMQRLLPDEKLISKHKELLEAKVHKRIVFKGEMPEEFLVKFIKALVPDYDDTYFAFGGTGYETGLEYVAPDRKTQLKALALAYKIKGKLSPGVFVHGNKVIAILNQENSKAINNK